MSKYHNAARFCAAIGIKYPIFQAPMAGVSTPQLAAAVTSSGGLGALPFGGADLRKGPHEVTKAVDAFAKFLVPSSRPSSTVHLNFFCHDIVEPPTPTQVSALARLYASILPGSDEEKVKAAANASSINGNVSFKLIERDYPEILEQLFSLWGANGNQAAPKVVSFHFGIPSPQTISSLQRLGILVFATATSLEEAAFVADRKIDGIILQGYEAGGHRGNFLKNDDQDTKLGTKALFSAVYKNFQQKARENVYLIPAGGIVTVDDIKFFLSQGASAVQLGTAFLCTSESAFPPFIRDLLQSSSAASDLPETTMVATVSGKSARAVETSFIRSMSKVKKSDLPPYGYLYNAYKTLRQGGGYGDSNIGFYLAGTGYPNIRTEKISAGDLVAQIGKELSA